MRWYGRISIAVGVILLAYAVQREIRVQDRELATIPEPAEPRFRPGTPAPAQEAGRSAKGSAKGSASSSSTLRQEVERLEREIQDGEKILAGISGELQASPDRQLELKVTDLEERIARAQAEIGRAERLREERAARRFDEYERDSREFSRYLTAREEERRRLLERVEAQRARVSGLESSLLAEKTRGFDSDAGPALEARLGDERVRLELLERRLREANEEIRSATELHGQAQLWKQREEQADARSALETERARRVAELERLTRERAAVLDKLEYALWSREELRAELESGEEELRDKRAALESRRGELARIFQVPSASEVQSKKEPS